MKRIIHSIYAICVLVFIPTSSLAKKAAISLSPEIKAFVEEGTSVFFVAKADLNGDNKQDFLLVLEQDEPEEGSGTYRPRPLLLLIRQADGTLKLAKRSALAVYCSTCGGVLHKIKTKKNGFNINTVKYLGHGVRDQEFIFTYVPNENTWRLTSVKEKSFSMRTPNNINKETYTPKEKVDIADFDPEEN